MGHMGFALSPVMATGFGPEYITDTMDLRLK